MTALRSPFGAIAYAPHLFWDNQSDNTLWNTDFRCFPSGLRNEAHPASWCGCLPHPPGAYGMKRIFVRLTFGLAVSPFPPANQRPTQDYARFWHTAPFPTLIVVKKSIPMCLAYAAFQHDVPRPDIIVQRLPWLIRILCQENSPSDES